MRQLLFLFLGVALTACGSKGDDSGDGGEEPAGPDRDEDGWPDDEDCDPDDPYINPGMDDIPYDGIDNDCAGDGDLTDVDGDGYDGVNGGGDDCNDNNPDIYPGGEEDCLDGIDNDCDETTSDNDCDGDGYDREYVGGDDCEDYDAERNPGAEEIWYDGVDQNCDGNDGDQDGDGEDAEAVDGPDCDDTDPERNTSAEEICGDGIDNNCDDSANQCFPSGPFDVGSADAAVYGVAVEDQAGDAVLGAGDLTGDGVDDLVTGSIVANTVWILPGPITADTSLAGASAALIGQSSDELGRVLAAPGDFSGDGTADLALGAPGPGSASFAGPGGGDETSPGVVYIVSGDTAGGDLSAIARVIEGQASGDEFGAAVDGYGDGALLVGAPLAGKTLDGEVYLLPAGADDLGDAAAAFYGTFNNGRSGGSLADLGDVNGDGIHDIAIGAPAANSGNGGVFYFEGPFSGTMTMSEYQAYIYPKADGIELGASLAGAGDIDGDGLGDMVIGAPGDDTTAGNAGMVFVALGPFKGYLPTSILEHQLSGEDPAEAAGSVVSSAGDLDGDGTDEIMVGAPGGESASGAEAGRAYLIMGPPEGLSMLADGQAYWTGLASRDRAGEGVGGEVDLNGDGLKDMLIGAPGDDTRADDAGAVYIVFGQGI